LHWETAWSFVIEQKEKILFFIIMFF